jgi:hypothetical protein
MNTLAWSALAYAVVGIVFAAHIWWLLPVNQRLPFPIQILVGAAFGTIAFIGGLFLAAAKAIAENK